MSIERMFSGELKRLERLPERALYKQTRKFSRDSEKKIMAQLTNQKKQNRKKKIAREVLWFFAAIVVSVIAGFALFYFIGEFFPNAFISIINQTKSVILMYLVLFIVCFIGVYFARIVNWALKSLTS